MQFKCKYTVELSKTFLFQAVQFSQTVLIYHKYTVWFYLTVVAPERVTNENTNMDIR